jgi:hypothetical protein
MTVGVCTKFTTTLNQVTFENVAHAACSRSSNCQIVSVDLPNIHRNRVLIN